MKRLNYVGSFPPITISSLKDGFSFFCFICGANNTFINKMGNSILSLFVGSLFIAFGATQSYNFAFTTLAGTSGNSSSQFFLILISLFLFNVVKTSNVYFNIPVVGNNNVIATFTIFAYLKYFIIN